MIKNFINTFFSSVFRVLGRFLAYAIVGIAFYLLAGYLGLLSVQAKEISVSGDYGVYRAQYKNRNGTITIISPAQYVSSNSVVGDSTSYTWFSPRESLITPTVTQYNYYVMPEFRVFANSNFKSGSFYTLNCQWSAGGEVQTTFQNGLLSSSVGGLLSGSSDYDSSVVSNVSVSYNDQYFTVTFKALQDFGSVRFRFGNQELVSNNQFTTLLLSNNSDYQQGFRIYVLNLVEAEDLNSALLGQITNQNSTIINQNQQIIDKQEQTNNKLDQAEQTRKGIWETIKELPSKFLDMLKGLFIPDNFDFLDDFKNTLETKLGFIAEVPIALLDFISGLVTTNWSEFNSISFPAIEIFGVNFWGSQEVSLQEAIDIFSPYKYITDVICVVICVNTLKRWYENFAGGGNS